MGLICLDLDGTLVESALVEEDGKLQRPQTNVYAEPSLLPHRFDVLHRAAKEGDRFAIVTNQGGVAWGYHTVAEVNLRIARSIAALGFFCLAPFSVHVAWKHPRATVPQFRESDGEATRRKPAAAMLLEAMDAHGIDQANTLMVGDLGTDTEAALAAGVDFALGADFFTA